MPDTAMILAAGLGIRMRPITENVPKPLVEVGGKPMIDYALDSLAQQGIDNIVVNVHHLAGQIVDHLDKRQEAAISDETEELLESGGGIVKALPLLGKDAFFILNADTFWLEPPGAPRGNLAILADAWNAETMDILLLTANPGHAIGYDAAGDFVCDADGRLTRFEGLGQPVIYAGAAVLHPRIFTAAPQGPFSLNLCFDAAISAGRLFGVPMHGLWLTVGTPQAIVEAESAMRAFEAGNETAR